MTTKYIIKKIAFIAFATGMIMGTQACAKKSFESLDPGVADSGSGGSGSSTGGSSTGGTSGSTTGGTTGGTSGGTTGGTTGGTSGGTTGGTTGGTSGGTTGGTTGGTSGGTTGGTTGGTSGGTTGGTTTGGSTTGGTCDTFDPNCTFTPRHCISENYRQPDADITRKLDVLIITDSSSSLDDEREDVANGITSYLSQLPSNVDARFAVSLAHGPTSWFGGRLYKSDFKDPREKYVISSQTNTASQIRYWMRRKLLYRQNDYNVRAWDNNGNLIPGGSGVRGLPTDYDADGGEAGLVSLNEAMRPYNGLDRYDSIQNLHNELPGELNFFRQDAALAVIFISDENDICTFDTVPDVDGLEASFRAAYCGGINPAGVLAQLQSRRQQLPLYLSSIIYTGKGQIPAGLENGIGNGYNTITNLAGGTLIDIASDYIPNGLSNIAAHTSERLDLRYNYDLSYRNIDLTYRHDEAPSAGPFMVSIDGGTPLSLNSSEYSFVSMNNQVQLTLNYAGSARSNVEIYYCLQEDTTPQQISVSTASYLLNKTPQTYRPVIYTEQR